MQNTQEIYQNAIKFAASKHGDQKIPSSDLPYVVHLSNVAMEILIAANHTDGFDLDFAIQTALLHDVLEDTEVSASEIEKSFGKCVLNSVQALSKDKSSENPIADSLSRIKTQPKEVWAVKLADRITNLQVPPAHWNLEKIRKYKAQAQEILDALKGGNPYLENRLRQKIAEYAK